MVHELLSWNWLLFTDVNQAAGHERYFDPVMIFSANDLLFIMPLLLLIVWFALARWSPLLRSGSKAAASRFETIRREGQRLALLTVVAVVAALALNVILGHAIYEPRPFISHPHTVHDLIAHAADASFPSDHEAVAWSIATMLTIIAVALWRRARHNAAAPRAETVLIAVLAVLALASAALIGVARIYVGVHYPSDIVGGAACGIVVALLVASAEKYARPLLTPLIGVAERLHLA